MRKIVLSLLLVFTACLASHAQGVKFETGAWSEMLAKAKAENKLVFVDVYTKWCGPCKHVSETVFPQEKLGEYYNAHFINFKIDAESPEGPFSLLIGMAEQFTRLSGQKMLTVLFQKPKWFLCMPVMEALTT